MSRRIRRNQKGGEIFTKSFKNKMRRYTKKMNNFRRDNIVRFGRRRKQKGAGQMWDYLKWGVDSGEISKAWKSRPRIFPPSKWV